MPESYEFTLALLSGALTSFVRTGAIAFGIRWAISMNKRDRRARFGAFCAAIGFGLGQGYGRASTRGGSAFEAGELGALIGFAALILALWIRWFKQRVESN